MTSFMEFMNYLVIEGRRGSHWDQNLKEDRLLTAQLLLNTAHDFRTAAPLCTAAKQLCVTTL